MTTKATRGKDLSTGKEVPIRKDFMQWFEKEVNKLSSSMDAETLVKFLLEIPQPEDVIEYVTEQLGERSRPFAKTFLQRRVNAFEGNSHSIQHPAVDDDSWVQSKTAKKQKKRKYKKVNESELLSFTVTPGSKLNRGGIEHRS